MIVPKRICIYPKDIQNITGKKEKAVRLLIQKIKQQLGKPDEGLITVKEFCKFTGISEEEVQRFLVD